MFSAMASAKTQDTNPALYFRPKQTFLSQIISIFHVHFDHFKFDSIQNVVAESFLFSLTQFPSKMMEFNVYFPDTSVYHLSSGHLSQSQSIIFLFFHVGNAIERAKVLHNGIVDISTHSPAAVYRPRSVSFATFIVRFSSEVFILVPKSKRRRRQKKNRIYLFCCRQSA